MRRPSVLVVSFLEANVSVKKAVAIVQSAVTGLESGAHALADWAKEYKKNIVLVLAGFAVAFGVTLACHSVVNLVADLAPVEAAGPVTIVETHSTTITQITQSPSLTEAPRPAEKKEVAVVVLSTEASQALSSSSSTATTLPSTKSESESTSAPTATTELPTMSTTSAPPSSTAPSVATPTSTSSNS